MVGNTHVRNSAHGTIRPVREGNGANEPVAYHPVPLANRMTPGTYPYVWYYLHARQKKKEEKKTKKKEEKHEEEGIERRKKRKGKTRKRKRRGAEKTNRTPTKKKRAVK